MIKASETFLDINLSKLYAESLGLVELQPIVIICGFQYLGIHLLPEIYL